MLFDMLLKISEKGFITHGLLSCFIKNIKIGMTLIIKISPRPSLPKRGIPPFGKGRLRGIL
jgi:hypothetical protein